MSPPCTLRRATPRDLDAVLDLYEAADIDRPGVNRRDQAGEHLARIEASGGQVLLAEQDGRPVATLTLFILPLLAHDGRPAALVEDVAVHPDRQGQGLGRRMMAEALRLAAEAGCYKLALSSNARRHGAHAFYERLGFERHGLSFVVRLDPFSAPPIPR